jgi:hypothetical protein
MKKLLGILFVLLLAIGYSACGGNSYQSPTAPSNAPGTTPTPSLGPMPTPTPY